MEKYHHPCYDDKGFSEQGVYFRLLFRYLVLLGKRLLAGETMRAFLSRWLPVILWCLVIYSFSESSSFTGANTAHVLQVILSYLPFGGGDEEGSSFLNFLIRKAAHLTEFGILAALVWRALGCLRRCMRQPTSGINRLNQDGRRRQKTWRLIHVGRSWRF